MTPFHLCILLLAALNRDTLQVIARGFIVLADASHHCVQVLLPILVLAEAALVLLFYWQTRRDLHHFQRCLAMMGIGACAWIAGTIFLGTEVSSLGLVLFSAGHILRALSEVHRAFRNAKRASTTAGWFRRAK